MRIGRLHKRQRELLPILHDLAGGIESRLDSKEFDAADPSLEPALDRARFHAGHLHHWLGELVFLVEREHSQNRVITNPSQE